MKKTTNQIDQLWTLLELLVSQKSITGFELSAALVLKDFFQSHGFEGELDEFAEGRANFYLPYITDSNMETLVFCSHIDVVPEGNQEDWASEPFKLTKNNENWVGRGVCDAKGSIAAMAIAFLQVVQQPLFKGNIAFLAVAGEERGSIGAKRFIESHKDFNGAVLIGEPTQMDIKTSQKGRIEFTLSLNGTASHASIANDNNVIVKSVQFLNEFFPMVLGISSLIGDSVFEDPSLAITLINSQKGSTNTIPGFCSIVFDRRWTASEDPEDIIIAFEKKARSCAKQLGIPISINSRIGLPAAFSKNDSFLFKSATYAREKVIGNKQFNSLSFMAGCDMHVFTSAGLDTIVCGPGDLQRNNAHGNNEWICLYDLEQAISIYRETANIFQK